MIASYTFDCNLLVVIKHMHGMTESKDAIIWSRKAKSNFVSNFMQRKNASKISETAHKHSHRPGWVQSNTFSYLSAIAVISSVCGGHCRHQHWQVVTSLPVCLQRHTCTTNGRISYVPLLPVHAIQTIFTNMVGNDQQIIIGVIVIRVQNAFCCCCCCCRSLIHYNYPFFHIFILQLALSLSFTLPPSIGLDHLTHAFAFLLVITFAYK